MDYQQNQQMYIQGDEDSRKFDIEAMPISYSVPLLPKMLQESKNFTLNFIEELKEKALTPISQEVLDHYDEEIKPNYSIKDIINIIDKRIAKIIRNKKIKKNWNFDDIILLLWFVSKYINVHQGLTCEKFGNEDWEYIAKLIPGSNAKGCMFKFISLKKVKLSMFNWSEMEEKMLKDLVKKLGQNKWKEIAEQLYEKNPTSKIFRTPKQCRQHWNCYLDPKLKKGPWSEAEDLKLLENVRDKKGQRKWSSIKHLFEGRTQNALKNRFNLLLERQKKLTPDRNESELIRQYLKVIGSTLTSIDPLPNSQNNFSQQSIKHSKFDQQIFEQALNEDIKQKILTKVDVSKHIVPQVFSKSEKSSFKLSEAYQDNQLDFKNIKKVRSNGKNQTFQNYIFVNMEGIPSIMTNQHGFYTNFMYKSFN